ncbi:MAG: tetratricopeptide repeat protein, partial [Deltaproteobacteria bacterium]|nr:tetratricopeptide repeat protein [Deltaproteobacteria bacterium]
MALPCRRSAPCASRMGPTGLTTVQAFCRYAPSGLAKLEPGQGALLPAVWESLSGMAGWSMQAGILRGAGGRFCRCRFAPAPRALLRVTALLLSPVLPAAAAGSSFAVEDMLPLSYVLLAAGFIAVLLTIRHLMRRSGRSSGTSFAMPRTSLGKRRLAQQLIGQRRYREAGDLFLEAGQRSAALDAYLQGGASDRAARLLESQGDLEGAARSYEAAGGHADAARLWLRLGQPSLAARNHEEAGQLTEAARLWTVAGEHLQAAEVLRRKGDLREAARSYQRAGLIEQTAEVYRQILDQLCGDGPSSADPQELAETARLTGRMFESLQQSQKAVEAYLRGGLPQEAIRVLVGAGRHNEAARILLDLGKLDRAIELFEQGGEKELAIRLKAKQARAAGDPAAAAELLLQVGERREAADLLSQARRFAEASRLYLELGDAQAAAYCCES